VVGGIPGPEHDEPLTDSPERVMRCKDPVQYYSRTNEECRKMEYPHGDDAPAAFLRRGRRTAQERSACGVRGEPHGMAASLNPHRLQGR